MLGRDVHLEFSFSGLSAEQHFLLSSENMEMFYLPVFMMEVILKQTGILSMVAINKMHKLIN